MIQSVRAFHIGGAAAADVASARGAFGQRHGVLLEIADEDGTLAFGEASPLPGFSRESVADVSSRVVAFPWERLDVPSEPAALAALPIEEPSLRFALEFALLSLLASRRRTTLPELLGGGAPRSLFTSVLIGSLADDLLLERATAARARGAVGVKVKVAGDTFALHRDRLTSLRDVVGPRVEIRLDFNGTLADRSREEIVDALGALAPSNIAFVEEPWSGARLLELGTLPVPWYADESLADPSVGAALQACPDAGGYVVKPTLLGLLGAWNTGVIAGAADRHVVVSHAFESSVALEACADLALALESSPAARAPGLDAHAGLSGFDLPPPPAFASGRAEIECVSRRDRVAFFEAVRERVARERPFFEWIG